MDKEVIEIIDGEISEVCPVCESLILPSLLQSHIENHFGEESGQNTANAGQGGRLRTCEKCYCKVLDKEWADHIYAHELQGTKQHEMSQPSVVNVEDKGCSSRDFIVSNDEVLACALQKEEHEEMKRQKQKEKEEFQRLQSLYGMNSKSGYRKQYSKSIDKDVSRNKMSIQDYYSKCENMLDSLITGDETMETCTKGVIERLQRQFNNGKAVTREHCIFCSPTDHFATGCGDKNWGCGYRNLQMLLSALLKIDKYKTTISKVCKNVPSIPKIQEIIENAWKDGFDEQGASQLSNKLRSTKKWIGATEIAVALQFIGLRVKIVDFPQPTASDGTHPAMFGWIKKYFKTSSMPHITPLYLQHQGHSRSVVGFYEKEMKNNSQFLLLFDPSHSPRQMQELCEKEIVSLSLLKKSPKQMQSKQYQIVYVDGVMESQEQMVCRNIFSFLAVSFQPFLFVLSTLY